MKTVIINCSRRKDGFSALMSQTVVEHLDSDYSCYSVYESTSSDINNAIVVSDLVVISCPVFSSVLVPPFWDFIEDLSLPRPIPCILVVSCGNPAFLCRGSVRSATKKLSEVGFSLVEAIMVDKTYGLSKVELSSKHLSRMRKACSHIERFLS